MACNSYRLLLFCLLVMLWDFNFADEEADVDDESSIENVDSAEDTDSAYTLLKFILKDQTANFAKVQMLQGLEGFHDDNIFAFNLMHYNVSPAIISSTCKYRLQLKKVVFEKNIIHFSNGETKIIQGKIEKSNNELSQKICSTKDSSYKQEYFQHAFCISQYMNTFIATCMQPNNAVVLVLLWKMGAISSNDGKSKSSYISREDGRRILCKANNDLIKCSSELFTDKCSKEAAHFMESMIQIGHLKHQALALRNDLDLSNDLALGSCEQYEATSAGTTETEQDEPVQLNEF